LEARLLDQAALLPLAALPYSDRQAAKRKNASSAGAEMHSSILHCIVLAANR